MNKGHGGQIVQLENIDRALNERTAPSKTSHAGQLEMATVDEPLNPMAPARPKPRLKSRTKSQSAFIAARDQSGLEQVREASQSLGPSIDGEASQVRYLQRLRLYIKQPFKDPGMAFVLRTQKSNTDEMRLHHFKSPFRLAKARLLEARLFPSLAEAPPFLGLVEAPSLLCLAEISLLRVLTEDLTLLLLAVLLLLQCLAARPQARFQFFRKRH